MKIPWGFLMALSMLLVMSMISIGAVLSGSADLFNRIAYPVAAAAAVAYAVRAMIRALVCDSDSRRQAETPQAARGEARQRIAQVTPP